MTVPNPSTDTPLPLSVALRTGTRDEHRHAERQPFVTALLDGRLPLAGYVDLVAENHAIYEVLEDAADTMRTDPIAGPFVLPGLARLPELRADLAHLLGPGWRDELHHTTAVRRYQQRMREVCHTDPAAFVAHHYTRYLGDLSGGQVIGRAMARYYGLTGDGTRFYRFRQLPGPKPVRDRNRALLDTAPFTAAQRTALLAEVATAFRLNATVFAELGARHGT
jgi:heme oxygenase